MSSLLLELVLPALGLAITPAAIATGILFLGSGRPVANVIAFAAPFALVYSGLAAVVLVASGTSGEPLVGDRTKSLASLAVGIVLLGAAFLSWRRARRNRAKPAQESRLMAEVETATPARAFVIGLLLAVLNPNVAILIAGLTVIAAADVDLGGQIVAAVFLVLASETLLVGPLVWYLAARKTATRELARLKGWLGRHEHQVDLGVLLVFGAIFTVKGIGGL